MDEGRLHVLNATLRVDTRNDVSRPWAGWYVEADYERGRATSPRSAPTSAALLSPFEEPVPVGELGRATGRRGGATTGAASSTCAATTASRRTRSSTSAWCWAAGCTAIRCRCSGASRSPGRARCPASTSACRVVGDRRRGRRPVQRVRGVEPAGAPAQCERMALAQAEYRGDIRVRLFGDDEDGRVRRYGRGAPTRRGSCSPTRGAAGWSASAIGGRAGLPARQLPRLGSFLADVGVGLDFGYNRTNDLGSVGSTSPRR
jgi:hypothetical protein